MILSREPSTIKARKTDTKFLAKSSLTLFSFPFLFVNIKYCINQKYFSMINIAYVNDKSNENRDNYTFFEENEWWLF